MGGGKTETYKDLQAMQIFSSKDNLFAKEMVRLFAIYKAVLPLQYTMAMIESSRKYYSPEIFEAMGVAVKNDAAITIITTGGVDDYINDKFNPSNHAIYYYSAADKDSHSINIDAYKTKDYLDGEYTVSTSFTRTFNYQYDMAIQNHASYGPDCTTYGSAVYQTIHGTQGPDTVNIAVVTNAYEVNPGEWYSLKDDTITDGKVTMVLLDASWVETGTEIEVEVPDDYRTMYIYRYGYTPDTPGVCTNWVDGDVGIFFKADIIGEIHTYRFLIFPIKDNGDFVEIEQYQRVLLADLGLGNGILNDSLSSPDVSKAMLSYSTDYKSPTFQPYIEEIYGEPGNYNNVVFNTPHYHIEYSSIGSTDPLDPTVPTDSPLTINFDGNAFSVEGRGVMILPVDIFQDMTMPDRYLHMNEIFRLWGNTVVEVDLKWYETGLFKLVAFIVVVIIAMWTGQYYMIGVAIGFKVGYQLLSEILPPEVLIILAVVYAVVTFDYSTTLSTFASIANVANNMSQYYFVKQTEDLQNELESYGDEQQQAQDAINEMTNDALYIPFDSYSRYYDGMYSITYESYGTAYDAPYNFDTMLQPKLGVRNG